MGFLSKIKENRQNTSTLSKPAQWLIDIFSPGSKSGVNVTEETAMNHSAVYAAVRVIAETVASLPLNIYEELPDGGKKKAKNNYLYPLLHKKPNSIMTSFTWREVMMAHLLLWGNHYSQLEIDNTGRVVGIWPLLPGKTQVKYKNKRLYYIYYSNGDEPVVYDQSEILHIPGLGFDGLVGKSVIKMAREAIGLGLAAEEFGARFFSQGAQPGGIIEYPGKMTDEAYQRYKKDVNQKYGGLGNSHKIMVLEEGLKYHQTGIPPDDAQFLETRKFQVNEIARIFRVPPHMLADLERATFSNIEQQSIDFVVNTIRPWLVRIEQVLNDKLISNRNTKNYIKFVVEGLLRGDAESRANYYNQMFQVGAMSINDIREKEDMNPVEGGDQNFVPLNMIPLNENNPKVDDERNRTIEQRKKIIAKRSAAERRKIRERYKGLIENAFENIVEREINKVQDVVNKELKNEQTFRDEIVDFYSNKFPEEVKDEIKPVLKSLTDAVADKASNEVSLDEDDYDIEEFFESYVDNTAESYAGYSRGQLLALMDEAIEENKDPVELVEQRLADWEDTKAKKTANKEAVKVEGAVTKQIFATAGITELIWTASSDPCPICQEMDGTVVGIENNFMEPSDSIDAKGGFSPSGSIGHPPLHEGCECSISPQ